jgi:lysophospholipase L1-like esterase
MPKKTAATIVMFAAIIFALQYAPKGFKLERYDVARAVEFRPRGLPVETGVPRHVVVTLPRNNNNHGPATAADPRGIIDPNSVLDAFYQALWRTESKMPGAITRVLHYGDSPVTADSITADARVMLQRRFGDAGHGFVLIAKPWAWYGHRGIGLKAKGWHIEAASQSRARDGLHGLGGVSMTGGPSAWSTIELPDDQHTRMEVLYEQQPGGGSFAVSSENAALGEVQTAADSKVPGFASFKLPAGASEVTLKVTSGNVRIFGCTFEKDRPGVVYNSLGVNGGSVQMALRYFEISQWAAEMQHENPDLVVINYGTNESGFPEYIERYYEKELRSLIERVRASVPHASLLIMSPMDRGVRISGGEIVTPDVLPRIVEIQAKVAMDMGCAFFNTFEAMGGAGTMGKWYNSQPRLVSADFMHPLPGGAKIVGQLLNTALCEGFEKFKRSHNMLARVGGPEI